MNFNCPGCQAGYRLDKNKIPPQGTHSRCKKCGTRFLLTRQGAQPARTPPESAAATVSQPAVAPVQKSSESVPGLSDLEQKLSALLESDDQDAAAVVFVEMITLSAKNGAFVQAQALLDRMYDDTPMALNAIMKAGELLEAEKCDAIDPDHLECWSELYEGLSPDETSALYFAMNEQRFAAGDTILRQGDVDGRLCLIEEGKLDTVFETPDDDEAKKLAQYEAGAIIGADLFFSFSVCTYAAIAAEDSLVRFIEKASLFKWMTDLPSLESKLRIYVETFGTVSDVAVKEGIERRARERHPAKVRAVVQPVANDTNGGAVSSYNVMLADLSPAGAGLEVRLSKPKEAEMLLGSQVKLDFTVSVSGQQKPVSLPGMVAAVRFYAFGDCTLHIHFPKPISEKAVAVITA
jgi:predicted Zn finger-like uncharacterized protein